MLDYIFGWIKDIVFYLILLTMVMHLLPNKQYHKYVKLFAGMLLVIIVISPMSQLLNWDQIFDFHYMEKSYEQEVAGMADEINQMQNIQQDEFMGQYKTKIQATIEELAQQQNLTVLSSDISIIEDEKDEKYLFPSSIHLLVKNRGKNTKIESIQISPVEISGHQKKEEKTVTPESENLKKAVADFYNLEESNINISVQE